MTEMRGFYIFLGRGDTQIGTETLHMGFADWKKNIGFMAANNLNTLAIYLGGHYYAYPSKKHPELVEWDSVNALEDFLPELIDYAHELGVQVILAIGTTGSSGAYWLDHPEFRAKKENGSDVGFGMLCPEREEVWGLVREVLEEVVELYPGADGILLHPQEFYHPCYCDHTRKVLGEQMETFRDLSMYYRYFSEKYIDFVNDCMEVIGDKDLYSFIVWLMDHHAGMIRERLDDRVRLILWDYNKSVGKRDHVQRRIERWAGVDDDIIFMPPGTICFSPDSMPDYYEMEESIDDSYYDIRLDFRGDLKSVLEIAESSGVKNICYFMGWTWESLAIKEVLVEGLRAVYDRC